MLIAKLFLFGVIFTVLTSGAVHLYWRHRCLRQLRARPDLKVRGTLVGGFSAEKRGPAFTVLVEVPFFQRYGVREWRVRVWPVPVGDRTRLALQPRGLFTRLQGRRWDRGLFRATERRLALSRVRSGVDGFDRAATVRASEPDVARALLEVPEVRLALLQLFEGRPLVGDAELNGHTLQIAAHHTRWGAALVDSLLQRAGDAAEALNAAQGVRAIPPRQLTERGLGAQGGAPVGIPLIGGKG